MSCPLYLFLHMLIRIHPFLLLKNAWMGVFVWSDGTVCAPNRRKPLCWTLRWQGEKLSPSDLTLFWPCLCLVCDVSLSGVRVFGRTAAVSSAPHSCHPEAKSVPSQQRLSHCISVHIAPRCIWDVNEVEKRFWLKKVMDGKMLDSVFISGVL